MLILYGIIQLVDNLGQLQGLNCTDYSGTQLEQKGWFYKSWDSKI